MTEIAVNVHQFRGPALGAFLGITDNGVSMTSDGHLLVFGVLNEYYGVDLRELEKDILDIVAQSCYNGDIPHGGDKDAPETNSNLQVH
jgi:hypothetical protein